MSTQEQTFDVVVLGAGSTGENVADIVVKGGLSAVVGVDQHGPLARESARTAHERDAGALDPPHLARVVPVRGEPVTTGEGGGDVLLAGDGLPGAVDRAGLVEHLGPPQQRLAGHAGPVGALAADQLRLDQRGGQTALHDDVGDVLPRRSRAEDDDVEGLLRSHARILAM